MGVGGAEREDRNKEKRRRERESKIERGDGSQKGEN